MKSEKKREVNRKDNQQKIPGWEDKGKMEDEREKLNIQQREENMME